MDRCGAAHRRREAFNAAARESLDEWAMSLAPVSAGASVLDLGCGAGKLTLPYARAVGKAGRVLGVDLAPDSIAELLSRSAREGLTNVSARVGNLDDVLENVQCAARPAEDCACNELHALPAANPRGQDARDTAFANPRGQDAHDTATKFDLIVSSYAIYYAKDMVGLIRSLASRLTEGGRVFVCGPGAGTNREMDELARQAAPGAELPPPLADFISLEQMAAASTAYAKFDTHRLGNAVRFETADALLAWWRNHSMYAPAADEAVARAAREHFAEHGEFLLTKNVLGVLFCR